MNEDAINLTCLLWDVPEADPPTSPVILNILVVPARAVLKKASAIRIPSHFSKPQSIILKPETVSNYHDFSMLIKSSIRSLDVKQNAIFFSDFEDEHKFIYSLNCLWAICYQKTEITVMAVTLYNDLTSRLVKWEKVSEDVVNDLIPPPSPDAKKQSIASMQTISETERRHRSIEIFDQENGMDFAGPIHKKNEEEIVATITVWKRYIPLLLSLNSVMFTIDNHFKKIGRTFEVNENLVSDICLKVLEEHTISIDE